VGHSPHHNKKAMAKERDSFVFYRDWWDILKGYDPKIRHEVYDALMTKVFEGETVRVDQLSRMALSFILPTIERDSAKYNDICERRKEYGRMGGKQKQANATKSKQKQASVADNDNVNDNDNGNELLNMSNYIDDDDDDCACARVDAESFIGHWNQIIDKATGEGRTCYMKKIEGDNIPENISTRLKGLTSFIIRQNIFSQDKADEVIRNYGYNIDTWTIEQRSFELAAKLYMMRAMKNLSRVKMKPKNTKFGSLQWFLNATNIYKLYNGDIQ